MRSAKVIIREVVRVPRRFERWRQGKRKPGADSRKPLVRGCLARTGERSPRAGARVAPRLLPGAVSPGMHCRV
jgi:hypothetical protein